MHSLPKSKQDKESAQTTTGAYIDVRNRGVRKLDKVLRRLEEARKEKRRRK